MHIVGHKPCVFNGLGRIEIGNITKSIGQSEDPDGKGADCD